MRILQRERVPSIVKASFPVAEKKEHLVHPTTYYTLNNIPTGAKLTASEMKTQPAPVAKASVSTPSVSKTTPTAKKMTTNAAKPAPATTKTVAKAPSFEEIKPILQKHTCMACHSADKKMIGPAYKDVAKRNYSNDKIVQLIWKPEPKNWPGYPTQMTPMPQVPKGDALKIAAWINSLNP